MCRSIWMIILLGLLMSTGCEEQPVEVAPGKVTPEDVRRDASQAVDSAAKYSRQTKEEFQNALQARLHKLDEELATLREKGRGLQDEAQANWDRKMTELEAKREVVRDRLAEVGQASGEAWTDVQQGAQSAWEDLDKAFRDAAQQFDSPAEPN